MSQELTLIPLNEAWADGGIHHEYMTCVNHTELRWLSKNPWSRSIHFLGADADDEESIAKYGYFPPECSCPMSDMRVIVFGKGE